MLTKDKKPEVEDGGKAAKEVIPPRPDTPKMFKAALRVTEQVGIEGTFAKLRGTYRPSDGSEVSSRGRCRTRAGLFHASLVSRSSNAYRTSLANEMASLAPLKIIADFAVVQK